MIALYSQLLARQLSSTDHSSEFIDQILSGTARMRDLLSDLLAFTALGGGADAAVEVVDLNVVLRKVLSNLQEPIRETEAQIEFPVLPGLHGSEVHFVSLFQNLIGNAIKYRSEQAPRIRIGFDRTDGHVKFSIADNGIGIESQYHLRIFVPFKRLHGRKIPGTGIGLAICQRIVERYGGRIWVDSRSGEGSVFTFVLPENLCVETISAGDEGRDA